MRASEPGPQKSTWRRGVPYTTAAAPLPLSCVVSARTSSDFCTVGPRLAGGAEHVAHNDPATRRDGANQIDSR